MPATRRAQHPGMVLPMRVNRTIHMRAVPMLLCCRTTRRTVRQPPTKVRRNRQSHRHRCVRCLPATAYPLIHDIHVPRAKNVEFHV